MSYVLIDLVDPVNEFPTSVWNWKAAVEVIRHLGVIDQFTARKMVFKWLWGKDLHGGCS